MQSSGTIDKIDMEPQDHLTEADTCRLHVTPAIQAAGWEIAPHEIREQYFFTDGRIRVQGSSARRGERKKADYLLRYHRDFPLAIVEAKAINEAAGKGLGQAKDYAEILGLKFAYATNGTEIIEYDYLEGTEKTVPAYPTPEELWKRLKGKEHITDEAAKTLLTPSYH